jgi:hypothetical protein
MLSIVLGLSLLAGLRFGLIEPAAHMALAIILVSLPAIPEPGREALHAICIRTASIVAAAILIHVVGAHGFATAVLILAAAVFGALVPQAGPTPALALLLLGARADQAGFVTVPGLWELAGGAAVAAVTALRLLSRQAHLLTLAGGWHSGPLQSPVKVKESRPRSSIAEDVQWSAIQFILRLASAVTIAMVVAMVSGLGLFGGHWLVTAVLLSAQRTASFTRLRLAQRLLGNTVAALLVALLMAVGPNLLVMVAVAVTLFFLAFSLRPINYLWWAMTAPPVLLIVSSFPLSHDWYEGAIRVSLNIVGALIVLAFLGWAGRSGSTIHGA